MDEMRSVCHIDFGYSLTHSSSCNLRRDPPIENRPANVNQNGEQRVKTAAVGGPANTDHRAFHSITVTSFPLVRRARVH